MEPQYFGHEHTLLFHEELSNWNEEEEEAPKCSRCGEAIYGPSFSCDDCGFYLHKQCAELHHPFHRNHPLTLLPNPPRASGYEAGFICNFCGEEGTMFNYHCSCNLDLHIKCALLTYNIAQKKFGELERFGYEDPLISTEHGIQELGSARCFGCWEPLTDSTYCSLDRGFNLHKKCVELPHEITYPCHPKHPLILQLSVEMYPCVICQETDRRGFFYCCSPCKFFIHITCLSPPSIIEDKAHQHPFTLFWRQIHFVCDACGVEGNSVPFTCSECNLLVHKKCISLPRIIKLMWHRHPLFHAYSLQRYESKDWDCVICRFEVDADYGCYHCSESDCHFIVHVDCVIKRKHWYQVIESVDEAKELSDAPDSIVASFIVIERNEDGSEAVEIKHFSHEHNLKLTHNKAEDDDKYCDGCTLSIWDSFYWCSQCNFFLHKKCAEFRKREHVWFHMCRKLLSLNSDNIFKCLYCQQVCNGFDYECEECGGFMCLRCVIPYTLICQAHEHPLPFKIEYEGFCDACGKVMKQGYKCQECYYALDGSCYQLPQKAPHKCDEHLLTLTYPADNSNTYSERNICDICEEERNPSYWFYYCATCDNSAHPGCVLGRYPFMKLGKMYETSDHPHHLTLVKKIHHYPECFACGGPCRDLAIECVDSGCRYIVHWDCVSPSDLLE